MPRNVETKARVRDPVGLSRRVAALADSGPQHLRQRDTFFECDSRRLKLREYGEGAAELIVYSRSDAEGPALSDYAKCSCPDADGLRLVLAQAYGVRGEVRKTREVYWIGRTRVHLDDVEGLGHYMELEVTLEDDEEVETGETEAESLMTRLEIPDADRIAVAYLDLLLAQAR